MAVFEAASALALGIDESDDIGRHLPGGIGADRVIRAEDPVPFPLLHVLLDEVEGVAVDVVTHHRVAAEIALGVGGRESLAVILRTSAEVPWGLQRLSPAGYDSW